MPLFQNYVQLEKIAILGEKNARISKNEVPGSSVWVNFFMDNLRRIFCANFQPRWIFTLEIFENDTLLSKVRLYKD